MTTMQNTLKEPRKKGHFHKKPGDPLPVLVETETGIPAHLAIWKSFSGRFNGDCVEVSDAEDISSLYNMGFFGKGSFSRGCPRSARKTNHPEIIRERQWKRRCDWSNRKSDISKVEDGQEEKALHEDNPEVIVIGDTDNEEENFMSHLQPRIENDSGSSPEVLNLLLEEALFLCYGLGCLYIFDISGQKILNCDEFWALCLEIDTRFIERYVTYHHFRSKGWVVKSGLKFGGDFLLYKDGPGFYHASYVVMSKVLYGENSIEAGSINKKLDWITLMGLNRLAETSGKEVLLCYAIRPNGLLPGQPSSPNVIKKFKVHEVIPRRWQPSVARIDNSNPPTKPENEESCI
ncbi:tRNA-splicing endonuclease subunit Sen2 [Frankliniella occidentalis]|uniref:tRNA-intron lyase n=1 Tax=Frankliniella occidentalis TaxID=133901 RepID=A0A6J1TJ16_FRAOC|nr:tRNA-splicing endonuclease subunit Sen2 [Frankliniella occidentalis]